MACLATTLLGAVVGVIFGCIFFAIMADPSVTIDMKALYKLLLTYGGVGSGGGSGAVAGGASLFDGGISLEVITSNFELVLLYIIVSSLVFFDVHDGFSD